MGARRVWSSRKTSQLWKRVEAAWTKTGLLLLWWAKQMKSLRLTEEKITKPICSINWKVICCSLLSSGRDGLKYVQWQQETTRGQAKGVADSRQQWLFSLAGAPALNQKISEDLGLLPSPLVFIHQNIHQTPRLQFGDVLQVTYRKHTIRVQASHSMHYSRTVCFFLVTFWH